MALDNEHVADVLVCQLRVESPVEVVGLGEMFGETNFSGGILVNNNIIVLLQPDFIVP